MPSNSSLFIGIKANSISTLGDAEILAAHPASPEKTIIRIMTVDRTLQITGTYKDLMELGQAIAERAFNWSVKNIPYSDAERELHRSGTQERTSDGTPGNSEE